tara:strand:+ start:214 stop:387 length:174 start_codon:yes stop_codon:yes gene_type:complete
MSKSNKFLKRAKTLGIYGLAAATTYGAGKWIYNKGKKAQKKKTKTALHYRDIGRYVL